MVARVEWRAPEWGRQAMRAKQTFAIWALMAVAAALCLAAAATRAQKGQGAASSLRSETRLITVDVSVRDKHGDAVRGLKASDFRIYDDGRGPQQIAGFEFIEPAAVSTAAAASASAASAFTSTPTTAATSAATSPATDTSAAENSRAQPVYSNEEFARLAVPPTAILVDPQNIAFGDQLWAHKQVMRLLELLPSKTPVAIFLLNGGLAVMQNFTTDRRLLRAAVDRSIVITRPVTNPQTGSGMAPAYFDGKSAQSLTNLQDFEDFEKMNYEAQTTVIADQTSDALKAIAAHLSAYPGPKNLVWVSEAFPRWILPGAGFGSAPAAGPLATPRWQEFQGSAFYGDKLRSDAQALVNAQVTVYPVDARGLVPPHLYDAESNVFQSDALLAANPYLAGQAMGKELAQEDSDLVQSQATMEQIADDTGGRACWNTNDLSGCAKTAIEDGTPDYEISYYPAGVQWDGSFHRIEVRTDLHGVMLRYRRGYSAIDTSEEAEKRPLEVFGPICDSLLPATSIGLQAEPMAQLNPEVSRYLLSISPDGLSVTPEGNKLELRLRVGVCEYAPQSERSMIYAAKFSKNFSDKDTEKWQTKSIETVINYKARAESERLRLVVLDPSTGMAGSLDVPAHPRAVFDTRRLSAAGQSAEAGGAREIYSTLKFHSVDGQSGGLDLSGDQVEYRGQMSKVLAAAALFERVYGKKYDCQAGKLAADDRRSDEEANLRFAFTNSAGMMALVNLEGPRPEYAGTLPVDASARAFFEQLWKMCHCQR